MFFEVSAKTAENVEKMFQAVGKLATRGRWDVIYDSRADSMLGSVHLAANKLPLDLPTAKTRTGASMAGRGGVDLNPSSSSNNGNCAC